MLRKTTTTPNTFNLRVAGFTFQLDSGKPGSKAGSVASRVGLFLFATPFAAFGLFALWDGINKLRAGGSDDGIFICLFGLIFAGVGFGLMYAAITAARRQAAAEEKYRAQTDGGTKPWLVRKDWAAGKIKSTTNAPVKFFLIWSFGALTLSAPAIWHIPQEWRNSNHLILVALIFPVAAIGLLGYSFAKWRTQRRFGDCFFELAQIPTPLGGTLDGLIQTGVPLKLEQGLHLKLSCIRRTVSGSGKNRSVQESVLWQDEKVFRNDASLPATGSGGSGIPVHFVLPGDQAESSLHGEATIIWRLEAKAKIVGPDFTAMFEVPVFCVAGTVPASGKDSDPTAGLQMSIEEIRLDENSRIQITDGPNGREFYFPAARNVGVALSLTVGFLAFGGFTVVSRLLFHSLFFEIAFGLVSLLVLVGCINLWLKSSRVTIDSSGVRAVNRWLIFSRVRNFSADDIGGVETKIGMTSGNKALHCLQLGLRANRKFTVASGIASKPEADWLVREMTRALGRKI